MTSAPFGLSRLGQVSLPAQDVNRATAFYRDRLGMKHLFSAPPGLAFFDCEGVRLMLSRPEGDGAAAGGGSILYFEVPDIARAHEALAARQVVFEDAPHVVARLAGVDLWMAFFKDSEGNLLALMSHVERPADGR